jgi:hypothetical protein
VEGTRRRWAHESSCKTARGERQVGEGESESGRCCCVGCVEARKTQRDLFGNALLQGLAVSGYSGANGRSGKYKTAGRNGNPAPRLSTIPRRNGANMAIETGAGHRRRGCKLAKVRDGRAEGRRGAGRGTGVANGHKDWVVGVGEGCVFPQRQWLWASNSL